MSDDKPVSMKKGFAVIFAISSIFGIITALSNSSSPSYMVNPDSEPRTDMLEKTTFSGIPRKKIPVVKFAISSLLEACPNISKYAVHGENIHVYYYPNGWEATPAHLDVELDLERESLEAMPQGLRDPQWGGHVELGVSGGKNPGAIMEMPLPLWLCNMPVDPDILSSRERHWEQEKRFLPLPSISPNSF